MITALLINIFLNYVVIKYLINFSQEYAIVGAAIATTFSNLFYLLVLATTSKKLFNTKIDLKVIFKSLFAGIIMVIGLILFSTTFDINIYLGILEILFGALIYFSVLFLIKGITKEDAEIFKGLIKF